jgi:hypothetical protein
MVPIIPLHIERGSSFDNTLQWLGAGKFIGPIEDLQPGYPTLIKVTGHQLNATSPSPVILSGINALDEDENPREMRNINSKFNQIANGTRIDDDWFSVPVATVNETWEAGSGEISHFLPSNITGWGGECNIRKNWHSPVLHTISTQLSTMTLDGTDGSVRLQIASDVTDTIELVNGVYDIDLWAGGGARPTDGSEITRVFKGPVHCHRDT